jgi:hypothetical protein
MPILWIVFVVFLAAMGAWASWISTQCFRGIGMEHLSRYGDSICTDTARLMRAHGYYFLVVAIALWSLVVAVFVVPLPPRSIAAFSATLIALSYLIEVQIRKRLCSPKPLS